MKIARSCVVVAAVVAGIGLAALVGQELLRNRNVPTAPGAAPAATYAPAAGATHAQTGAIGGPAEAKFQRLASFCLNGDGNLLCCDSGAGRIEVVSPAGRRVGGFKAPTTPEAVCVDADGAIYVAGAGKVVKVNASGSVLKTADLPKSGKRWPRIGAVTAGRQDVFVSAYGKSGFAVHRFNRELAGRTEIISGLRGCCGQMDIKARGKELFVAENGRFRVCRYDREGKLLGSWGKRDRSAPDGWGGCCNPMNLCFAPDGNLLTSESTSPGRVKRFSLDGKFLGLVGEIRGASGCKHVAVAVSKDGGKVFVVDTSKKVVHVLAKAAGKAAK